MTDSGSEGIADILTARGEERREWLEEDGSGHEAHFIRY